MATAAYQRTGTALANAIAMMDVRLPELGARLAMQDRRRRRDRINLYTDASRYGRLLNWLSAIPDAPLGGFASTDEAVAFFRKQRARWRAVKANYAPGHYVRRDLAMRQSAYRDKLTVALYFARHGQALWALEAA